MINDRTAEDPTNHGAESALRNPEPEQVGALRNPPSSWASEITAELCRRDCADCGESFPYYAVGRPRRYCSAACKQRAHRRRRGRPERLAPEPYWSDDQAALYVGGAADVLARMPEHSVQSVVTSPPYYGLRDYGGHPDQIGQEPTPGAYVDALLEVFTAIERVLHPDGTVWVNLGDTYSARADAVPKRHAGRGHRDGVNGPRANTVATARRKSLLMMPARVAIALTDAGWIVRNRVVWHKPNAMPESVTDRLATRYEDLFLLSRSERYYFDLDAIKVAAGGRAAGNKREREYAAAIGTDAAARRYGENATSTLSDKVWTERNPGDVWTIATRPNPEAHFAMFPPEIPTRCILASTRPGDVVLDPFSGAGTTGTAARALGRRYVGIDLHAEYHDLAADRLGRTLPTAGAS